MTVKIKKLPDYLINKLKAGEIVERPVSVVKELVENALDAGATEIEIEIIDGGKKMIKIEDNGSGISYDDMEGVLERYATSKMYSEEDLYRIATYGFRGEALASIAEVSKCMIQTKVEASPTGYQLLKLNETINIESIPFKKKHGTIITISDLFYNTPVRQKFLKSHQTEYFYIYEMFVIFALMQRNVKFTLKKDTKTIFNLPPHGSLFERFFALHKAEREKNCIPFQYQNENISIAGIVGNSSLSFGSGENIKIFVNKRYVQDRIIKKAVMQAFDRQITPGMYPLALITIDIHPEIVDVNVHPRKLEVRFQDPHSIYQIVLDTIKKSFENNKTSTVNFTSPENDQQLSSAPKTRNQSVTFEQKKTYSEQFSAMKKVSELPTQQSFFQQNEITKPYRVLGQLRNTYISVEEGDCVFFIDQHALEERIFFEKMKRETENNGRKSHILLQPLSVSVSKNKVFDERVEELSAYGFDISRGSEHSLLIYAIPEIFHTYIVEIETLLNDVLYSETLNPAKILDSVFATKACKKAVKAGDYLSMIEMERLVDDGYTTIEGMFVCQHGRPFFIKIPKKDIDSRVGR